MLSYLQVPHVFKINCYLWCNWLDTKIEETVQNGLVKVVSLKSLILKGPPQVGGDVSMKYEMNCGQGQSCLLIVSTCITKNVRRIIYLNYLALGTLLYSLISHFGSSPPLQIATVFVFCEAHSFLQQ